MKWEKLIGIQSHSEDETHAVAGEFVKFFKPGDTVLLYGDLGSGKTFLVREFAALLGYDGQVSSPSFTIVNQYDGETSVNHLDLYRIESEKELKNLGLEELLNSDAINFIEWPQLVEKRISWRHFRIRIETKAGRPEWRNFILEQSSD